MFFINQKTLNLTQLLSQTKTSQLLNHTNFIHQTTKNRNQIHDSFDPKIALINNLKILSPPQSPHQLPTSIFAQNLPQFLNFSHRFFSFLLIICLTFHLPNTAMTKRKTKSDMISFDEVICNGCFSPHQRDLINKSHAISS
jgi:hypothetical protein